MEVKEWTICIKQGAQWKFNSQQKKYNYIPIAARHTQERSFKHPVYVEQEGTQIGQLRS